MSVADERPVFTTVNASEVEDRVAYTSCFAKTDSREIYLIENRPMLSALSPGR